MSEYWKSTPKYWCKHCKTFVRDTKLERTNHEATPKHQGNLKRFLRDLHRGHEKEEKDKERAKSEVARLNGLVSGSGPGEGSSFSNFGRGPTPTIPKPQATASQRKQQLAQLAEMGVSIPDEFRGEMAMAGEWQVTSERLIDSSESSEKNLDALGFGVRKRVIEEDDEAEGGMEAKKTRWGSTLRAHPDREDDLDLDLLLRMSTSKRSKQDPSDTEIDGKALVKTEGAEHISGEPEIKTEPKNEKVEFSQDDRKEPPDVDVDVKRQAEIPAAEPMFKKRSKAKNIRQR